MRNTSCNNRTTSSIRRCFQSCFFFLLSLSSISLVVFYPLSLVCLVVRDVFWTSCYLEVVFKSLNILRGIFHCHCVSLCIFYCDFNLQHRDGRAISIRSTMHRLLCCFLSLSIISIFLFLSVFRALQSPEEKKNTKLSPALSLRPRDRRHRETASARMQTLYSPRYRALFLGSNQYLFAR